MVLEDLEGSGEPEGPEEPIGSSSAVPSSQQYFGGQQTYRTAAIEPTIELIRFPIQLLGYLAEHFEAIAFAKPLYTDRLPLNYDLDPLKQGCAVVGKQGPRGAQTALKQADSGD